MGHIDAHTTVHAAPDKVYDFVADPRNAPHYIGAIRTVSGGPQGRASVGDRFNASGELLGQPAYFTLRINELTAGKRVSMALEGQPAATIVINLSPAPNGQFTEVHSRLEAPSLPTLMLEMAMGRILRDGMQRLAATLNGK